MSREDAAVLEEPPVSARMAATGSGQPLRRRVPLVSAIDR
jgi:hypothetical protein